MTRRKSSVSGIEKEMIERADE
jgi:ABC-type multidrug transport system fused ATPase/permease subunit